MTDSLTPITPPATESQIPSGPIDTSVDSTGQTSNTPAQPVVPLTAQPSFQQAESSQSSLQPEIIDSADSKSNWKVYGVIGVMVLVLLALGGYILYNQFLLAQQPIALDGISEAQNPVVGSPAPQLNYNTPENIIPPEGPAVLPPDPSPPPVPKISYTNYQYSFGFAYVENTSYQDVSCTAPTEKRPNSENKFIFIDTSNVNSNEDLQAFCEYTNTEHKAKIQVSETPIECLGDAVERSVGGVVTGTQCAGKTTSSSSLESSTSLLIPKEGNTIVIEINSPEYMNLLNDVVETFTFEVGEQPAITES